MLILDYMDISSTSCDAKSHELKKIGQPFEWHKMLQISDIHVMKWKNKDNVAQDFSSNFTENSNGARHISIIVDSQPCIKSINKHKSHPVPLPRQQVSKIKMGYSIGQQNLNC